jgi:hypothetical protein
MVEVLSVMDVFSSSTFLDMADQTRPGVATKPWNTPAASE